MFCTHKFKNSVPLSNPSCQYVLCTLAAVTQDVICELTAKSGPLNFLSACQISPLSPRPLNLTFQNQFSRSGKYFRATFKFLLRHSTNKFAMGQIFLTAFVFYFCKHEFWFIALNFEQLLIRTSSPIVHFFISCCKQTERNTFKYQQFRMCSFSKCLTKIF